MLLCNSITYQELNDARIEWFLIRRNFRLIHYYSLFIFVIMAFHNLLLFALAILFIFQPCYSSWIVSKDDENRAVARILQLITASSYQNKMIRNVSLIFIIDLLLYIIQTTFYNGHFSIVFDTKVAFLKWLSASAVYLLVRGCVIILEMVIISTCPCKRRSYACIIIYIDLTKCTMYICTTSFVFSP